MHDHHDTSWYVGTEAMYLTPLHAPIMTYKMSLRLSWQRAKLRKLRYAQPVVLFLMLTVTYTTTIQRPMENLGLVFLVSVENYGEPMWPRASAGASDEFLPHFATKSLGITRETQKLRQYVKIMWNISNISKCQGRILAFQIGSSQIVICQVMSFCAHTFFP